MFAATGWDLGSAASPALQQYPTVLNKSGDVYTIVRRNEFEHARATMSVVIQNSIGELHVYCKVRTISFYFSYFILEDVKEIEL